MHEINVLLQKQGNKIYYELEMSLEEAIISYGVVFFQLSFFVVKACLKGNYAVIYLSYYL